MANDKEWIDAAIKPLLGRGFAVTESAETPASFGDARIVLASDTLSLRFTRDRGQLFVDVAAPRPAPRWYDLREVLTQLGLRAEAGEPWASASAAVDEIEAHEALVRGFVADENATSTQIARE